MSDKTGIEWTDATWNPIAGCSIKSPGCTNCYAMDFANRLLDKPGSHYEGTTKRVKGNAVWTGKVALAPDHILTRPLKWKRPRRIFVNSMSDLFHEDVPDEWIDKIFAVMALCPQHIFQILTKRPERMRKYSQRIADGLNSGLAAEFYNLRPMPNQVWQWPLSNVWLGASVEDQKRADERIHDLIRTPAAVRFLSCEPLLGPIHLSHDGIDWVIAGGESGHDARPMHPDWLLSLRDQCQLAGVPFFFKQWGEWFPIDLGEIPEKLEFINWNDRYFRGDQLFDWRDGNVSVRAGKKFLGNWLYGRKHEEFPASLPAAA